MAEKKISPKQTSKDSEKADKTAATRVTKRRGLRRKRRK